LSFILYATSCPKWWFLTYLCLFNFTGLMSCACTCIVWDHCLSWVWSPGSWRTKTCCDRRLVSLNTLLVSVLVYLVDANNSFHNSLLVL
jgi:hypothetical protein